MNPFLITETFDLLPVIERVEAPANFLHNIFFPQNEVTMSDILALEYRRENRHLAPFVSKRSRANNVAREGSKVNFYKPLIIGAKRVIGMDDISRRIFGETPVYSGMTPDERAAQIQTDDLRDLKNRLQNRREWLVAQLMQTNKIVMNAFAEDGRVVETEEISFDGYGVINPTTAWSQESATILDDLKAVCDRIAQDSNLLPTVMIVGSNVENYLLGNDQFKEYFSYTNRDNITALTFKPHYISPSARYIGYLNTLGIEIYSYNATYVDESGQIKPFVEPNNALIGVAGRGKFLYGRVDYLDMSGSWQSVAAQDVPVYGYSADAQTTSLTIMSRCLPVPSVITDFACIKTA